MGLGRTTSDSALSGYVRDVLVRKAGIGYVRLLCVGWVVMGPRSRWDWVGKKEDQLGGC